MMKRIWTFAFIFFFVLPPLSFCAEPQYGGILRTSWWIDPRMVDPQMAMTNSDALIVNNCFNSLLRWNKEMSKTELDLAESVSQPDHLTYIFKLKKGVRFHDLPPVNGREVTSEDVKFSIERMTGMHGERALFPNAYRLAGRIASISTPDSHTIVLKTKEPFAPFLNFLASHSTSVVAREAVQKFGDLRNNPIGTGPFFLKEWVRGSHILLMKNPHYFKKGLPYLDGIHIRIIPDMTSATSALMAGHFDYSFLWVHAVQMVKENAPHLFLYKRKGQTVLQLRFPPWSDDRPLKPPFDKKTVRQAIAMALDKNQLVKVALDGYATPQIGPVANWPPYSLEEKDQIEYNPSKARKLIAEAGHPNGFSVEILNTNVPYTVKAGQLMQAMLKDVGVEVRLKFLDDAQFWNRFIKLDYQMTTIFSGTFDDPAQHILANFSKEATLNKWNNKEIHRLIEEQNKTMDPQKRLRMIHDIQRKILEDAASVYILSVDRYWAFQPWVFPKDSYFNNYQENFHEGTWMAKK